MRRYLPYLAIALVMLIALQFLYKKKNSTGTTSATTASQTISAMNLVDKDEQAYKSAHGRFTSNLADLLQFTPHLANDVGNGININLEASTDGHTYLAQIASSVLSLTRTFADAKVTSQSCIILKSGSGVACPAPVDS
jgi:hypothetical protein